MCLLNAGSCRQPSEGGAGGRQPVERRGDGAGKLCRKVYVVDANGYLHNQWRSKQATSGWGGCQMRQLSSPPIDTGCKLQLRNSFYYIWSWVMLMP